MKFRNFAVICILMLLVIPSTVKGAVNAIDILSKSKKAAGGNAWDEISTTHVQMKITTGGLEGTAEGWENVLTGQSLSRYQPGTHHWRRWLRWRDCLDERLLRSGTSQGRR